MSHHLHFPLTEFSYQDGLFVYAALVVRALISNSRTTARSGLLTRVLLIAAGALLPWILPMLVTIYVLWSNQGTDPGPMSR